VFGVVSLGVLAASLVRHDSAFVQAMAISALGLVIGRMWMTLREVRQSVANYQDARTDDLTGLANRRAFLERLESPAFLQDGTGRRAGVLLVDLDGFKEVNDALGHAAGDELLRVLAGRFDRRLGEKGFLARLGGDEYAFACMVRTGDDLVAVANEFSEALLDPCEVDGTSVRVGASIGVAMSHGTPSSGDELLRCADVAMYESKRNKCGVSVYRADADPNSRDRLALLHSLRNAIDARDLLVYFQPTLDMRTASLHGLEALVRWQHPSLGLLEADSFVPLAERNSLMPQLTRAVLDLSLAQAAHLDESGHRLRMSVNISRHDLVDEDLPDYIDRALERNHFPHDRLTLEITESALGGDPDRAERCVRELRARGLRISIDDFGVGYSSMSQLLELSIDELKIDKSFVLGIISDPRARAIVRSSVELARALDLSIVAEGIETVEVFEALQAVGADIGQGNMIGPPMAPQQLESFLSQADRFRPLRARTSRLLATGG
jgi:diguanylate cyclase (GGDEF)-like protein